MKKKIFKNFFCKNKNYKIVRIYNRSILKNKFLIKKKFKRCYFTKPKLIKKGIIELNKALKIYEKENLQSKKILAVVFLIMGFFSLFIGPKIALFYPSFAYLIAFFEFLGSIYLNIYITYKRIKFIYSYPLDCNPKEAARALFSLLVASKPLFKYTAAVGGSALAFNYFIQDLRGVNIIQEIGENYIDNGKSASETASILKEKLYKGYKEKD